MRSIEGTKWGRIVTLQITYYKPGTVLKTLYLLTHFLFTKTLLNKFYFTEKRPGGPERFWEFAQSHIAGYSVTPGIQPCSLALTQRKHGAWEGMDKQKTGLTRARRTFGEQLGLGLGDSGGLVVHSLEQLKFRLDVQTLENSYMQGAY